MPTKYIRKFLGVLCVGGTTDCFEFAWAKFRQENLKHAFTKWAQEVAFSSKSGGGNKIQKKTPKKENGTPNFLRRNESLIYDSRIFRDDPKRKYNTYD